MSDIFDVPAERERRRAAMRRTWAPKRAALDEELKATLAAALASPDPCAANAELRQFEELLAKRKRATADVEAEALAAAAAAYFGTTRQYTIIYADPPWRYKNTKHLSGTETRYKTMSHTELAAMPVAGLAAPDAVLVMWTTFHMIDAAASLFNAWGFELLTVLFVWVKVDRSGAPVYSQGAFTRPCSEFALLGTRGKSLQIRQRTELLGSILRSRPRGHSRKPAVVADAIVRIFGDFPRIELFARRSPPDWDVWGDQTTRYANEATGGDSDGDSADDDDEELAGLFVPRKIDRRKMKRDRFRRVDVAGAAESWKAVSTSTSIGILDHEFDAEVQAPRAWAPSGASEAHDHDGTRPCCRPLAETLRGTDELRNTAMLSSYLERRGGYATMRNTLYTHSSEASVRAARDIIRQQQDHNADMLFAINYNVGRAARAQVAVRAPPDSKRLKRTHSGD
jgi:N6-adenosine-specific RNA methylase IME4